MLFGRSFESAFTSHSRSHTRHHLQFLWEIRDKNTDLTYMLYETYILAHNVLLCFIDPRDVQPNITTS